MKRRPNDDVLGGLFVLVVCLLTVVLASGYSVGSARRMGPGYFPLMIGASLGLLGVLLLWRGLRASSALLRVPPLRPPLLVLASVVAFGLLIERLGLAPAAVVSVLVAAYAVPRDSPLEVVTLAAGLAAFVLLLFIGALEVPMAPLIWPL